MLETVENRDLRFFGALAAATALIVLTAGYSNLSTPEYQKLNKTPSTGTSLESINQYRFSELNGSIVYGPYLINDTRYFVHGNRVLDENLKPSDKQRVKRLHNFYLKTYLDPLFYSPEEPGKDLDLDGFEKFESQKILTDRCGLEYDLIPQKYFESLEKNHRATEKFIKKASRENAENLMQKNRESIKAYSEYIGNFTQVLTKNVSGNKCFRNGSIENSVIVTLTPGKHQIKTETLLNYTRMANENAEKLVKDLRDREKLLTSSKKLNITYNVKIPSFYGEADFDWNETETRRIINERRTREYSSKNLEKTGMDLITVDKVNKFLMQPVCLENQTLEITGTRKDVYPNIITRDRVFSESHQFDGLFENFFSVSKCPYVEETRLNWYVMDGIQEKLNKGLVSEEYSGTDENRLESAENIFIQEPDQRHFKELSDTYNQILRKNLAQDKYSDSLGDIWRRGTQSKSKIDQFKDTYNDFYNNYHMKVWQSYWPTPVSENGTVPRRNKFRPSKYFSFILMESEYPLTFMTWSSSVWRLETQPDLFSGSYSSDGSIPTIWKPQNQ